MRIRLLHCLLWLFGLAVWIAETAASGSGLAEALAQVVHRSEMASRKTLYIHLQASVESARPHLEELLTQVLQELPSTTLPRRIFSQQPMEYKPYVHAVLLLVNDLQALQQLYGKLRATQDLSHTLIYMSGPSQAYEEEVQGALRLLWRLSVLNVGLVLRTPGSWLIMVTYFPFSPVHGCQVITASIVNRYQDETRRWASTEYFPPKLVNFYGCVLTCATWEDMPYLVLRRELHGGDQPGGGNGFVGIEGALLQFLADNLNFTAGLYWMNKEEVLATFNETGWVFDEIFGRHADFSLGGFHFKPSVGSEIPYSQSTYYFMSHIMLVTNLQSAYSAYEKLAFPFHPLVWQATGLVLALGCLLLLGIDRRWQVVLPQHPYYQFLVLTMGGNLPDWAIPRRVSGRLLLLTWLFSTLVLRGAYQSGMYQLLRQDTQRNPPQTIADVLAQRFTIQLMEVNAARILDSLPELRPEQMVYLSGSELQSFLALAQSSGSSARLATLTPYEYFGYFRKVHPMSRRLHLVRERIYTQHLAFYVRRHSHLVGVLNGQIRHAHAHGFLEHWTRQYVSAVDEADEGVARISSTSYSTLDGIDGDPLLSDKEEEQSITGRRNVLSMRELAALFWLILWANLFAVVVFALELVLHSRSKWKDLRKL
ncbi:uncharacterized protein LOC108156538 [Drosophila miranda]|uniref:uncharacterized protein LOC108156538 n=1 Tax=Drosophila miranda TaxID=7229 RepID=UPI0007E71AE3|nr:uncharacterized protein LOC108156538 [Drosophila miranda]